jgi:hypothetical protein
VRPSLSPPPADHAALALIDRLPVLPGHVERVVLEGAYHGSSIALGQMVSHFDEIDVAMIAEGLAAPPRPERRGTVQYRRVGAPSCPSKDGTRRMNF